MLQPERFSRRMGAPMAPRRVARGERAQVRVERSAGGGDQAGQSEVDGVAMATRRRPGPARRARALSGDALPSTTDMGEAY